MISQDSQLFEVFSHRKYLKGKVCLDFHESFLFCVHIDHLCLFSLRPSLSGACCLCMSQTSASESIYRWLLINSTPQSGFLSFFPDAIRFCLAWDTVYLPHVPLTGRFIITDSAQILHMQAHLWLAVCIFWYVYFLGPLSQSKFN